jgi:hypothetical protein
MFNSLIGKNEPVCHFLNNKADRDAQQVEGAPMISSIKQAIDSGDLPNDRRAVVGDLLQNDGSYVPQEGFNWDYKQEWPFSYSDDYFLGIARLICAFANTAGGIIIFGVHDKTRGEARLS